MSRQDVGVSAPFDDRDDGRPESPAQRADRNWNDVLQELRVLQTGTQILTGFLLALAFQPAFADLAVSWRGFYLALVSLSALSAVVALAPVAVHRAVFQRGIKPALVTFGHRALLGALALVSLLLVGVVVFVFGIVVGATAGVVGGVVLAAAILVLWVVMPETLRRRSGKD
ncbi:MAG: multisubunit Na+/H+ antiporter, MnhB subunit [Microbacterium sp.]|nr:multisubunit Na+/H+ antiporter, MnhB subunit [Microbacterium sp.]